MAPTHTHTPKDTLPLASMVERVRARPGAIEDVRELARMSSLGLTRLDAQCRTHYHLNANALLERARVYAGAAALQGDDAPVANIGEDVGFSNPATFERTFVRHQGITPTEYRALVHDGSRTADEFRLRLPRGFATGPVHHLMNRDPSGASEEVLEVSDATITAARGFQLAHGGEACVLHLRVQGDAAQVRVTPRRSRACTPAERITAHRIARRLLGFESHVDALRIRTRRPENAWFAPLLAHRPGLRVPLMGSEYEALIWAILGQQVNLTFAAQLRAELIRLAQPELARQNPRLLPHPTPAQVAALAPTELHRRRFSRSKATWVVELSAAIANGHLDLERLGRGPADAAHDTMVARKGIGAWTAQYVMLRGMGYNDCVPAADAGLMRNLQAITDSPERPRATDVARWLAPLAPARSLACQHVWTWQAGP